MEVSINEHGAVSTTDVIGYVREGGCENERCIEQVAQGRPWHAIPRGFAVTLPMNHYATRDEAVAALTNLITEHGPNCQVHKHRADLAAELKDEPANPYLLGAWVEYWHGGDQEVELCDCGAY